MNSEETTKVDQEEVKEAGAQQAPEPEETAGESAQQTGEEAAQEPAEEAEPEEAVDGPGEKQEDEDLQARFIRLSADFQNYKKRVEKEKSDIYAFANEKIVLQMLDVMDNFERAMETDLKDEGSTKFAEGMALIFKQLQGVLEKNNVTEIPALGEVFDPKLHNAVMTESQEGAESGTVTKVFQKGYMLNNKVIRASMVAVAQ